MVQPLLALGQGAGIGGHRAATHCDFRDTCPNWALTKIQKISVMGAALNEVAAKSGATYFTFNRSCARRLSARNLRAVGRDDCSVRYDLGATF